MGSYKNNQSKIRDWAGSGPLQTNDYYKSLADMLDKISMKDSGSEQKEYLKMLKQMHGVPAQESSEFDELLESDELSLSEDEINQAEQALTEALEDDGSTAAGSGVDDFESLDDEEDKDKDKSDSDNDNLREDLLFDEDELSDKDEDTGSESDNDEEPEDSEIDVDFEEPGEDDEPDKDDKANDDEESMLFEDDENSDDTANDEFGKDDDENKDDINFDDDENDENKANDDDENSDDTANDDEESMLFEDDTNDADLFKEDANLDEDADLEKEDFFFENNKLDDLVGNDWDEPSQSKKLHDQHDVSDLVDQGMPGYVTEDWDDEPQTEEDAKKLLYGEDTEVDVLKSEDTLLQDLTEEVERMLNSDEDEDEPEEDESDEENKDGSNENESDKDEENKEDHQEEEK